MRKLRGKPLRVVIRTLQRITAHVKKRKGGRGLNEERSAVDKCNSQAKLRNQKETTDRNNERRNAHTEKIPAPMIRPFRCTLSIHIYL